MKATLRLAPHTVHPDETIVEVRYAGKFIAAIYGADGPGIRVISKHITTADSVVLQAMPGLVHVILPNSQSDPP